MPAMIPENSTPIILEVKGRGHVPALKNSMYAVVNKNNRQWKKECVNSFVCQLLSASPTSGRVTLTMQQLSSLIASLPPDDNWKVIAELRIRAEKVLPGQEGALLTIEQL